MKCAHAHISIGGDQPAVCPGCSQQAFWTTEPVPLRPWALTENDKRFLRSIRVSSNNDHEDDGA
jgi:hypothetical protein